MVARLCLGWSVIAPIRLGRSEPPRPAGWPASAWAAVLLLAALHVVELVAIEASRRETLELIYTVRAQLLGQRDQLDAVHSIARRLDQRTP